MTILQQHGYRVIEAGDGRQGLAAAAAERPDLVITDVLMPVMDGWAFVKALRREPVTAGIPVLFYTAHYGAREARELARSAGVSGVLIKPVDAVEVLRVVLGMLSSGAEPPSADVAAGSNVDRGHLRLLGDRLSEDAADLQARNARLRAVINIGLEIGSEPDALALLHRVCSASRDLFAATYVTIGVLGEDGTAARLVTCGADDPIWVSAGNAVSGILRTVVTEQRTIRRPAGPGATAPADAPPLLPGVQAFVVAPLASPTHVYGWICLVGDEARPFTEEDEDLVTALAAQVGRVYESRALHTAAATRTRQLEHEMSERLIAEAALREEHDRAQRYLDTAGVILLALDLDGRITLVNRHACAVLGWSAAEMVGRDWFELCVPARLRDASRTGFRNVLAGDLAAVDGSVVTRAGEARLIEWRNTVVRDGAGEATGTLSSGTDVTERSRATHALQQAQKMEAIGRLAGGIAHDFNNLLTVILGHCELLLMTLAAADPSTPDILLIQQAGASAAALTGQLLAFSRKQIIAPALLDLSAVVAGMRPMLDRLIREDVKVVLALAAGPVRVTADRSQVEQIVMNLAVNARDAMPHGGTLTIATAAVAAPAPAAPHEPMMPPGEYIALTVSDTGTGMTPDVQARLFEPFFTTKETGHGTGLGLASVHGIVKQSGGSIAVQSEMGRGTSVTVYLPRAAGSAAIVEAAPAAAPQGRAGTILVVDDADGLRELTRRMLQRQGYTVLVAGNADDALHVFRSCAAIDVVLSDVVMPDGSGPDLIRRLSENRPGLKVIYMSGYTEDSIAHHGVLKPGIDFLHKPFSADALARKVREVLDR